MFKQTDSKMISSKGSLAVKLLQSKGSLRTPFNYVDSSEESQDDQPRSPRLQAGRAMKESAHDYEQAIQEILTQEVGTEGLTGPGDRDIMENVRMRNERYKYFMKQIEIDKKYRSLIEEKVRKIRVSNIRKHERVQLRKLRLQLASEKMEDLKHQMQRQDIQEKVLRNVRIFARQLAVENATETSKKLAANIQKEREKTAFRLTGLEIKQRHELEELRKMYDELKSERRVSEKEQERVLRSLREENERNRIAIEKKLSPGKQFQL